MKTFYVYILLCADNSYYTGVTNDIDRRFEEHSSGVNKGAYTHSRRPLKLVWYKSFKYIDKAIQYEKQIKGWSRKKKIALINGEWDNLVKYSKNYTDYGKQE